MELNRRGTSPSMKETAASRFGCNLDLLLYWVDHIFNARALANLVLVSKDYHTIFTPHLWKEITDLDLKRMPSLSPEKPELHHVKTLRLLNREDEGGISRISIGQLIPRMSNLENFIDLDATDDTIKAIRENCVRIRSLHLYFRYNEPVDLSTLEGFANLTSLILDNLRGLTTWKEWGVFLANLVLASPNLEELGLFNLFTKPVAPLGGRWPRRDHFIHLCGSFAERSRGKTLRLRSLLLGASVYPPGQESEDYIKKLTDPKFLEHLHIAAAGGDPYHFRNYYTGDVPNSKCVLLPSFISPEATPRLRLVTTVHYNNRIQEWLLNLHSQYPDFARRLMYRISSHYSRHANESMSWRSSYLEFRDRGWIAGLHDMAYLVAPLDLPRPDKAYPFAKINPTNIEDSNSNKPFKPAPPPRRKPSIHLRCLTLPIYWPRPGDNDLKSSDLSNNRACLLHTSLSGALKSVAIYFVDYSVQYNYTVTERVSRPNRSRIAMITTTLFDLLNGLDTLKELYIPLRMKQAGRADRMGGCEVDWVRRLVWMLASKSILPRLRYAKIAGVCFEVVRGVDGNVTRLLDLDWHEQQRLDWFRDIWEARGY
ncbi:hypothetical protein V8F20_004958 [Naviculisporaceae sp. PSN 640]